MVKTGVLPTSPLPFDVYFADYKNIHGVGWRTTFFFFSPKEATSFCSLTLATGALRFFFPRIFLLDKALIMVLVL